MKKYMLTTLVALCPLTATQAQAGPPRVGEGTTFSYVLELHGQHAPFALTIARAADTLQLRWRLRGVATGGYAIAPTAWQQADALSVAQPQPGRPVRLPARQTFMLLSKSAYANLLAQHRFTYNNTVYDLRDDTAQQPLLLGGQPLDVLHVVAQQDPTELWILRNPNYPIICQMAHSPLGVNWILSALENPASK